MTYSLNDCITAVCYAVRFCAHFKFFFINENKTFIINQVIACGFTRFILSKFQNLGIPSFVSAVLARNTTNITIINFTLLFCKGEFNTAKT